MKTYQAKLNKKVKGVYGISLVHDPAMEGDFLSFSKQEPVRFAQVDKEKRVLMGLVLEPNKLIYRNQGGEEFNVFFSKQDIEDVAYNFQKQSFQTNSSIEHDGNNISGLSFVETWIVSDTEKDKSAAFGFSYPVGSWVAMMKVDNDEIWNDYVKTGRVKGFSIDAFMHLEEVTEESVNFNKIKMEEKNVLQTLMDALKKMLGDSETEVVEDVVEAADVKEDEDKKKPKEEVEMAKDKVVEEVKEVKEIEVVAEAVDFSKQIEEAKVELSKGFETVKVELSKEIESLKTENVELKKQVVELSKEPAENKVNSAPVQLDYSKMTNYQKMQFNKENR
tara:strand:+ start:427 stop:1428 length:1002 start_codon:yes stop_codon:yes gene_type:complete